MNASGESIDALMKKLNVSPTDLIIIHDDLDLPVGKIRLRLGGSSGGHKGIDSIISHIGTRDFHRVRVGIGRPESDNKSEAAKEDSVIGYVLSDFTSDERKIIEAAIPRVGEAVIDLLTQGLTAAMNKYN
jgi:PTH1 family peptidyl-tRNA hydrolase